MRGFLAGLLKRVGAEVRMKKRMRVDRPQQRSGSGTGIELERQVGSVSPPPSSRDSGSTTSPISAVIGSGPFNGNGMHGSWNGNNNNHIKGHNPITAFPQAVSPVSNGNGNGIANGYHSSQTQAQAQVSPPTLTNYPVVQDTTPFYPESTSTAASPSGWASTSDPNGSPNMTWDEVYATSADPHIQQIPQIQQQQPVIMNPGFELPPSALGLTGHTMTMGSQWTFNAEDSLSPLDKWAMEDLCPPVNFLVPNA